MGTITYSVRPYCDRDAPYYRPGCEKCRAHARIRRGEQCRAQGKTVAAAGVRQHIAALRRAGFTPERIAREAGVSERAVAAIWSGLTRRPTRGTAERIAAIPVPAPALLSLDDAPTRPSAGRGAGATLVSARPVRLYAVVLRELGMTHTDIGRAASAALAAAWVPAGEDDEPPRPISGTEIGRIIRGERRWFEIGQARAVLDVELPALAMLPAGAANGAVHVHGSRRRLQGLAVDGHSAASVAEHLGVMPQYLQKIVRGELSWVGAERARDIAIVADWLADGPVPAGVYPDKVRKRAERHGWLPLDAWSDEAIDDPYGLPLLDDAEAPDPVAVWFAVRGQIAAERLATVDRIEVVRRLAALGRTDAEIADVLDWRAPGAGRRPGEMVLKFRTYHGIPSCTGEEIAAASMERRRLALA